MRVIINGCLAQTGAHRRRNFNVFQVIPGLIVLENRDARQLPGLGLHAVEEVAVPGHRVVLADQLGEQHIVQRQAVGVQRVGFVVVGLFPGVEQICVLLTVILQGHAVAIGEVAVVVFEPQQRLGFVELAVQKVTLGGHVRTLGSQISPHGAVGRGGGLVGGGTGAHPE